MFPQNFSCASSWELGWTLAAAAVKSCNMDGGTDRALDYSRVSPEHFPRSHWNAQICIHGRFWLGALRNPLHVVDRGAVAWAATSSICKGLSGSQISYPWSITAPRQQVHDLGMLKDLLASQSSLSYRELSRSHSTSLPCCSLFRLWS